MREFTSDDDYENLLALLKINPDRTCWFVHRYRVEVNPGEWLDSVKILKGRVTDRTQVVANDGLYELGWDEKFSTREKAVLSCIPGLEKTIQEFQESIRHTETFISFYQDVLASLRGRND